MTTEEMLRLKRGAVPLRAIAEMAGVSHQTVFHRLGGRRTPPKADNDNHPERTTRHMPFNGGCSTASGVQAISLRRCPTVDGVAA